MKLILASASPRRAEILQAAGFPFSVLHSAVDETPSPNELPTDLVQRLANAKAELVAARAIGPAIVIAADTVVAVDARILGKPRSSDEARKMLELISGRMHTVLTGVSLVRLPDVERREFVEATQVHFARMTPDEISAYLATDEPFDKAGAYAIQGIGGRYVTRIEGDYFNVVGLPLSRLARALSELGYHAEQVATEM